MSISRKLKDKFDSILDVDKERIRRMAWEDRTPYKAIEFQFDLTPSELVHFMRYYLEPSRFRSWRKRVFEQGKLKNTGTPDYRFKSRSQRVDGSTKNYK